MTDIKHSFSVSKGFPQPLGISPIGGGINFAIYSKNAKAVSVCLFESMHSPPLIELNLLNRTGDVWHGLVHPIPTLGFYAYRLHDFALEETISPCLLDPYAKALFSSVNWNDTSSGNPYQPLGILQPDTAFDWENVEAPNLPIKDLIIYEMHVRGFTNDRSSEVKNKGKFLGVVEKIPYFKKLGINAIKLLPIQEFNEKENLRINPVTYQRLFQYWGYSTVSHYSPMNRYAVRPEPGAALVEFKTMVRELHRNGIEVLLDIVFNHTAEGERTGPTYSFKGIDAATYYMLNHEGDFKDFTGCGNTFNCNHPVALEFIQSCLRYWVSEMHIDGFRFDLASIFYRGLEGDPIAHSPIVEALSYDPILANTKLIAEPWDAAGMYQVGNYYPESCRWSEWNGKYRDSIRRFIKGIPGEKREFASRLCGSQDLYGNRLPTCSINFVTAHDGFSLADLVSYNHKHNIENGENNYDGMSNNDSWNCGAEGLTLDKKIITTRENQKRNFILGLMISQGVPMIQMGDEYSHTKKGNNNTWCQDNSLNWFLWDALENNQGFFRFYIKMIRFRLDHPILRQGRFLTDQDITWHGANPLQPDWDGDTQFLACVIKDLDKHHDLYIAFNVRDKTLTIDLPEPRESFLWHLVINTSNPPPMDFVEENELKPLSEKKFKLHSHSAILLKAQ